MCEENRIVSFYNDFSNGVLITHTSYHITMKAKWWFSVLAHIFLVC